MHAFHLSICPFGCGVRHWAVRVFGAMLLGTALAPAQVWDGGGGSGNWGDRFNWNPNALPGDGDNLRFDAADAGGQYAITLGGNRTARGITFSNAAGTDAFSFAGSILTIGRNGITNNDAQTQTFGSNIYVNNGQTWNAGTGGLTFTGDVALNRGLTINGTGNTTVSGVISNAGGTARGITKNGTGMLTLSGANTYTGATNVNGGTLRLGGDNVLANRTDVTVAVGATLDLNGYTDTIDALSGAGVVTLGSGTLTVGANNGTSTFSGSFATGATGTFAKTGIGTLTFGSDLDLAGGTLELNNGTLALNGHSSTFGSLHVTGNSTIDFGFGTASVLEIVSSVIIDPTATLTIRNWADAVDYFYSLVNPSIADPTVFNRITFQGFASPTKWVSFDSEITPVPEASLYGAALLGFCMAAAGWRRRRRRQTA